VEDDIKASALPLNIGPHLKTLKELISRLLRRDVVKGPVFSSAGSLLDYLHSEMSNLTRETMRVLFLDVNNRLIHEETMWEGSIAAVECYPREIITTALKRHATALILVHNHPSGNPIPSTADIEMTRQLCAAGTFMNISVHDHIVISCSGHISMRAEGLLDCRQNRSQERLNMPFWKSLVRKFASRTIADR
jgi:DNA repair protein RadC